MEVRLIQMMAWGFKSPEIIGYTPRREAAIGNEMCRWLACKTRDLNKEKGHDKYEECKLFMLGDVVEIAEYDGKEVPDELFIVQEYINPHNITLTADYAKACEITDGNRISFMTVDNIKNIGEDYPDTITAFVEKNIHKWR